MMFWHYFKITGSAVGEIFFLAAIGYFLVKRHILADEGLDALSRLVIAVAFPFLIFCRLVKNFTFSQYTNWWLFPLISIAITLAALALAGLFSGLIKGQQHKWQFINLIAFQNAGYLPLALMDTLLPPGQKEAMFIYIFLFLIGFNLVIFSFGAYTLTFQEKKRFPWASLFSPPVIAVAFSLLIIFLGWHKFVPQQVFRPLNMIGDCALPLAMLVIGGNLAQIKLRQVDKKAMSLVLLGKLALLPALGLWLAIILKLPQLLGMLLIIQLAMPSATTLSVLLRHFKKEDLLVSQGIFLSHIASILTIPVFLSLYFTLVMIK